MIPAATIVLGLICANAWIWTEVELRWQDRRRGGAASRKDAA